MTAQYIVNGLTMGLIYALIAIGYSLVFGILRMINMAHGAVYAFGAHMILMFVTWNLGAIPAVILSIILTGGLLVAYDRSILAILRKKKAPGIAALITTIGFSHILTNGLQIAFGTEIKSFPALLGNKMIQIEIRTSSTTTLRPPSNTCETFAVNTSLLLNASSILLLPLSAASLL